MEEFDKKFEELASPKNSEESLKEFSNWILGLSIGLCAFLVTESKDLVRQGCCSQRSFYVAILIIAMLSTLIAGINKYFILKRDSYLSAKQDIFKSIVNQLKLGKIDLDHAKTDWDNQMIGWTTAFKQILIIGYILELSLILTIITAILTGVYIILAI